MEINIEDDNVRINESGIKLLKLKSQVAQRIGSLMTSGKDFIAFPLSSLPLLTDLIGDSK